MALYREIYISSIILIASLCYPAASDCRCSTIVAEIPSCQSLLSTDTTLTTSNATTTDYATSTSTQPANTTDCCRDEPTQRIKCCSKNSKLCHDACEFDETHQCVSRLPKKLRCLISTANSHVLCKECLKFVYEDERGTQCQNFCSDDREAKSHKYSYRQHADRLENGVCDAGELHPKQKRVIMVAVLGTVIPLAVIAFIIVIVIVSRRKRRTTYESDARNSHELVQLTGTHEQVRGEQLATEEEPAPADSTPPGPEPLYENLYMADSPPSSRAAAGRNNGSGVPESRYINMGTNASQLSSDDSNQDPEYVKFLPGDRTGGFVEEEYLDSVAGQNNGSGVPKPIYVTMVTNASRLSSDDSNQDPEDVEFLPGDRTGGFVEEEYLDSVAGQNNGSGVPKPIYVTMVTNASRLSSDDSNQDPEYVEALTSGRTARCAAEEYLDLV